MQEGVLGSHVQMSTWPCNWRWSGCVPPVDLGQQAPGGLTLVKQGKSREESGKMSLTLPEELEEDPVKALFNPKGVPITL